ncbi:MAG: hypothetical protein K2L01_06610 [Rikenellaceae bacterium]|nr:hypothetical protein [Rikenellaceae bacterium]
MIEFLLGQYKFYSKEEENHLAGHLKDKEAVKAHIALLERRYRRFKRVYAINTTIIKVVPIMVLAVYLIAPTYALGAFVGGLAAIVLSESFKSIFCPLRYFDSIGRNILILKSIEKFDGDRS